MQVAIALRAYAKVSLWKFTRADFSKIAIKTPDYLYKLLQKLF